MQATLSSSAALQGSALLQQRRTARQGRSCSSLVRVSALLSRPSSQCAIHQGCKPAPACPPPLAASLCRGPAATGLPRPAVLPLLPQAHNEGPLIVTEKKELRLPTPKYCESIHQTRRRPTRTVDVRGGGQLRGRGAAPHGAVQISS